MFIYMQICLIHWKYYIILPYLCVYKPFYYMFNYKVEVCHLRDTYVDMLNTQT